MIFMNLQRRPEYHEESERGHDDERGDEGVVREDPFPVGRRLGECVGQDDVLERRHREDGVVLPTRVLDDKENRKTVLISSLIDSFSGFLVYF